MWDGTQDGSYYRIPCVCVTKRDTLLVAFEHRYAAGDWARMDIELYRSTDGGEHFAPPVLLAAGSDAGRTVNNPVLIADNDGTVHFLYCVEYGLPGGGVFCRKSTDDGIHWSEPADITAATAPAERNVFATGPCHGLCLADGTLLVPAWLVPKAAGADDHAHHPAQVHLLISRDNGEHWTLTESIPQGSVEDPNETCAAPLPDGRVLLNIRTPVPGDCRSTAVFDPSFPSGRRSKRSSASPSSTSASRLPRWQSPRKQAIRRITSPLRAQWTTLQRPAGSTSSAASRRSLRRA